MTNSNQPTPSGSPPARETVRTKAGPGPDPTVRRLRQLFEAEPELILAFLEQGNADSPKSIETIYTAAAQAAEERPTFADVQYYTARAALAAGRLADADRFARAALKQNAGYLDAMILAARIARERGRPCRAIVRLRRAVTAGAEYADVHLMLGDLLREQGNLTPAEHAYRRALDINPNVSAARDGLTSIAGRSNGDSVMEAEAE